MIKDLINTELNEPPYPGLDVHIIKKYVIESSDTESFEVKNLSILLIKSGLFRIKLQEAVQDLSAHELIVIPKNSYCTILEVRDKLQFFLISFSTEFTVKYCLKKELVDSFYFFIRKEPLKTVLEEKEFLVLSLIYKLIYFVNKEKNLKAIDSELQRISLNLFLYELKLIYSKYSSQTAVNFTRKESLVMHFLTILAIHYRKQHSVPFYAGSLYVTSGYLNKVVREITGKNVKALIIDSLISEAKILLEDPHQTVDQIAEELEFSSKSVFSNFFKKHTALTPTEYRSNAIERFKSR